MFGEPPPNLVCGEKTIWKHVLCVFCEYPDKRIKIFHVNLSFSFAFDTHQNEILPTPTDVCRFPYPFSVSIVRCAYSTTFFINENHLNFQCIHKAKLQKSMGDKLITINESKIIAKEIYNLPFLLIYIDRNDFFHHKNSSNYFKLHRLVIILNELR